jgi:hypothetical protein
MRRSWAHLNSIAKSIAKPRATPFLLGFVGGIFVLSALGHVVAQRFAFQNFQRIHRYINPEALFYPTASELVTFAKSHVTQGQTLVILGGSSVMTGDGQGTAELWSDELAQLLGDEYAVLNYALPGGASTEHGAVAAQALLKEGYKVLYVGDTRSAYLGSPDGYRFPYVFWDAAYKGLLNPSPEQVERVDYHSTKGQPVVARGEIQWQARLDSALYFNDLWGGVGYDLAFLTWTRFVTPAVGPFFMPRRLIPDPVPGRLPLPPLAERIPASDLDVEMRTLRGFVSLTCVQQTDGTWKEDAAAEAWPEFRGDVAADFPTDFRAHMIALVMYYNPTLVERLSPSERDCYVRSMTLTTEIFEDAGYRAAVIGSTYTADDFLDRVHHTASGGRKLATDVAPLVRAAAQAQGYVQ